MESLLPFMGGAFLFAMEGALGESASQAEIAAWEEVYDAISTEMMKDMLLEED
jgi:hemoglobin-like flavoprotein